MTPRHLFRSLSLSLAALLALSVLFLSARAAGATGPKETPLPAAIEKPAPENLGDLKAIQEQVKKVLDQVIPCTVNIRIGGSQGSGVIVSEDGYVLTAGHVVGEANRDAVVTLSNGRHLKAKTLGANHYIDSGMLKISEHGKWPHVDLGKSADLKKGQWVVTTGHPGGWKEGRGVVVRLGRILQTSKELIRTDCTIVGGDSGGPVFDMTGKVVGIHSRIAFSLASNIHVPIDTYQATWDRLIKGDVWGNAWVGFQPDSKSKLKGCRVEEVRKDSPAEKGGLKPEDLIVKFNGQKIESLDEFGALMREANVGSEAKIEVQRGEEIVSLKIKLGKTDKPLPSGPMEMSRDDVSKNSRKVLTAFRDLENKARQSTVKVECDGRETVLGTVVGPDGWVLTKLSELKGNKTTCKLSDGRDLDARLVGVEQTYDLALLKVEVKGLTPVEWDPSKQAPVGNWVASAGPGQDPVAVGVVSVGVRKGNPKDALLPSDSSKRGYLGIRLAPGEGGVKIESVENGSAADKAHIKANDVVVALGDKAIKNVEEFIGAVGRHKPGEKITLKIKRGSEVKEITAKLGQRPPDRGEIQNSMGGSLSPRRVGFPSFLQHDTVLKPQECGGPVLDLDGKAIGINIARAGRTETYAIPTEALQPLLVDLMSGKLAPKESLVTTKRTPTAAEKVAEAKAALLKVEAEKIAADKKVADAKAALEKAEAELKKEKDKEKVAQPTK